LPLLRLEVRQVEDLRTGAAPALVLEVRPLHRHGRAGNDGERLAEVFFAARVGRLHAQRGAARVAAGDEGEALHHVLVGVVGALDALLAVGAFARLVQVEADAAAPLRAPLAGACDVFGSGGIAAGRPRLAGDLHGRAADAGLGGRVIELAHIERAHAGAARVRREIR